jgi:DNA mismatch repair protein MutS2
VRERATTELEALLREIRLEAADIFEELKRDPSQRGFERARRRLKDIQSVGKELADETAPAARTNAPAQKPQSLARGDTVRVDGLSQTGVLLDEPVGRQVQVQVGPMRMTVDVAKLSRLSPAAAAKPQHRAGGDKLRRVMTAATEIHLRQMRAEDAELELSKFLDEAILAGLNSVRIVHGKGEGVLRKLTHDVLRRHKGVKGHSLADPSAGGDGVTIAELR